MCQAALDKAGFSQWAIQAVPALNSTRCSRDRAQPEPHPAVPGTSFCAPTGTLVMGSVPLWGEGTALSVPSLSRTLSLLLSVMLDLKKPFFPHLPALGSACWLHRFLIQISHTNFCLKRSFAFESPRGRILEIGIFTVWCRKAQPGNLMLKCTHSNSGEQDTCGVWAVGWKY